MDLEHFWKKEKRVWHDHFIPGLLAGLLVALVSFFFRMTGSNIALFASIGASAVILTHKYRHHLTMLRTIIGSYLVGGVVSFLMLQLNIPKPLLTGGVIFVVTLVLYSVNLFHPPAISVSLAIVLYQRELINLAYLIIATLIAFVLIRLAIYTFYNHLNLKDFVHEFVSEAE